MKNFEYAMPSALEKINDYLAKGAVIKAGGIDLLDMMKEELLTPERLVNIRQLDELHFLDSESDGALRLGPNLTLDELATATELQGASRSLAQAAAEAATPQIRNVATLGGNLCQRPRCWYFRSIDFNCTRKSGDTCFAQDGENQFHAILGTQDGCVMVHPSATAVALLALEAELTIQNKSETRRVPVEDFFVPPATDIKHETILQSDEVITEVLLPASNAERTAEYCKLKQKQAFDWPLVEAAVSLDMDGSMVQQARVALGAVAPIPWRAHVAESVLRGSEITHKLAMSAADEELEDAEPLSQNIYKVQLTRTILYRTICRAAGLDPMA